MRSNRLGTKVAVYVIGNLILYGICYAAKNEMEGKDIFGREKKVKRPHEDWKGNIVIPVSDYSVV